MGSADRNHWLRDYDIVGAGALRRQQAQEAAGPFELLLHPELVPPAEQVLYEAMLDETLSWLKPQQVRKISVPAPPEEFLIKILNEEFETSFPRTTAALKGEAPAVLRRYLAEFPWQGPLRSAQFRYLPTYLRREFQDSRLSLIAQKEWLWSYLSFADFGLPAPEKDLIFANPSLQTLYTSLEVSEVGLTPGLYVLYYSAAQGAVQEHKMDIYEAAVVDLLQDDRKFRLDQVLDQVQMTELESPLSPEAWGKKLFYLIEKGIILKSSI